MPAIECILCGPVIQIVSTPSMSKQQSVMLTSGEQSLQSEASIEGPATKPDPKAEECKAKGRPRGSTPLHLASFAGNHGTVQALCEGMHDPPVNMFTNHEGHSALMCTIEGAAEGHHTKSTESYEDRAIACARVLVAHGADLHMQNFAERTALHLAFDHKQDAMADFLIDQGAKGCMVRGRRCRKCALGIKLRARARAAPPPPPPPKEDTSTVLQEEFGDGDFLKELSLVREEINEAGHSGSWPRGKATPSAPGHGAGRTRASRAR